MLDNVSTQIQWGSNVLLLFPCSKTTAPTSLFLQTHTQSLSSIMCSQRCCSVWWNLNVFVRVVCNWAGNTRASAVSVSDPSPPHPNSACYQATITWETLHVMIYTATVKQPRHCNDTAVVMETLRECVCVSGWRQKQVRTRCAFVLCVCVFDLLKMRDWNLWNIDTHPKTSTYT